MGRKHRIVVLVVALGLVVAAAAAGLRFEASTAADPSAPSAQDWARSLLNSKAARYMTAPALRGLAHLAGVAPDVGPTFNGEVDGAAPGAEPSAPTAGVGPPNVLVNDPRGDVAQPDQTTQNETTIAVHANNVVVGFNDSQQALPIRPTAGATISGFAYSTNGGDSFVDGGVIPNAPGFVNLGDPWLAADRAGTFYYSTLMLGTETFGVGVAASTNGGRTFSSPVPVSPTTGAYQGDKPAMTVGRDPSDPRRDDIYVAWDDFQFDESTFTESSGLPVARSTDGGRTWQTSYADRFTPADCNFRQYIGAQPIVDPGSGVLRVFAERIDSPCLGATLFSQWVFTSIDGGRTFVRHKIADVTPVSESGVVIVAPGQGIRTIEFPVVAEVGSTLYAAWNDGGRGTADVRLATSSNGGATWSKSWATSGGDDDLQPALTADTSGIHLAFYRVGSAGIALEAADSLNGTTFSLRRVSSVLFPGVLNLPQFDPFIADGYMGDYVAIATDGVRRFYAWGDNRNRVVDGLYPQGRADPDVFFARI